MIRSRQRGHERSDLSYSTVLVSAAMHEELRLIALAQEGKIGAIDGDTQTDQMRTSCVPLLTDSTVVLARAQACTTKIETQHGQFEGVERFRHLIDHLVVHGPAKQGVWVTHDSRERRAMPFRSRGRP